MGDQGETATIAGSARRSRARTARLRDRRAKSRSSRILTDDYRYPSPVRPVGLASLDDALHRRGGECAWKAGELSST